MLNRSITTTLAALAIAGASVTAAYASEEALLDALVKKGVLKQADAQKIKAESAHAGSGGNSKIKLNESVKEMAIYGSLNLRWQHSQARVSESPDVFGNPDEKDFQNQQARFRLLLGTKVKLADDISVGVELATQNNATQRYQTLGQGSDYAIGISQAYVNWHPTSALSFTAGRQTVPFYSTEMVWDKDVRLDGLTENINLGKLLGFGDGFSLKLVAGQFMAGDNMAFNYKAPNLNGIGVDVDGDGNADYTLNNTTEKQDSWFYQTQIQAAVDFGGAKLTVAPGIMWSNGSQGASIDKELIGTDVQLPINQVENLGVLLLPGDVSFDLAGTHTKFFWDFAYNYNTQNTNSNEDRLAWLAGIKLGQNQSKGDFSVSLDYRSIGAQAVNPAYSDSDFGLGQLNQRGFKFGAAYSLTKAAVLSAGYSVTNNLDKDGWTVPTAVLNNTHLVTIDLGVKF